MNAVIRQATESDLPEIARYDAHIPAERLCACIRNAQVYVLYNADSGKVAGVLRYSLFWQTIPYMDLLFLNESVRRQGYGSRLTEVWEREMAGRGYRYVMTSTQADETAWIFYEKRGYRRAGGFFPPDQSEEEWMYVKALLEVPDDICGSPGGDGKSLGRFL